VDLGILLYLPIAGAIIGLATKWAAIKLIFHPARYIGVGPIGWQGIVQRRSPKFAAGVADTVTATALTVDDLVARIDGHELAEVVRPSLEAHAPELAAACIAATGRCEPIDAAEIAHLERALPTHLTAGVSGLVDELAPRVANQLDVRSMVIELLSGENADRLARLTQRVAARELRWVIWYGGILGFGIGAVGVIGYVFVERWWLLPIIGAIDGLVNNWLAIQMIFRPFERTRYLGVFPYQGLFPARQPEIAREYGVMMAAEVLTPANLLERLLADAPTLLPDVLAAVDTHLAPLAHEVATTVGLDIDTVSPQHLLLALLPMVGPALEPARHDLEELLAKRLDIAATIEGNLASMPKSEFEHVLRGIFEEDEITLILLGGVLGGAIGCAQAAALLAIGVV
jgi:uncharacterized membrane protein YheB (UPF0754 family)